MRQLKISKQVTNRDSQSLDLYLREIGQVDLITAEEEVRLAREIREGNDQALEKLVSSNLRFVVSVAKQYQNQGLTLPDLINEGNLGLIKAAQRFDETRGFKFISYAVWWIRQSILSALAEQARIVRLPLNKVGALNKISKAFARLEQEYEREPTADEVAAALDIPAPNVRRSLEHQGRHLSIDAPLTDSDGMTMSDTLASPEMARPDSGLLSESLSIEVSRSLSTLSQREQEVIQHFFGISGRPHTMEEIGEVMGLTRERVRQIKEKALRKLKSSARSRNLRMYLD